MQARSKILKKDMHMFVFYYHAIVPHVSFHALIVSILVVFDKLVESWYLRLFKRKEVII